MNESFLNETISKFSGNNKSKAEKSVQPSEKKANLLPKLETEYSQGSRGKRFSSTLN